MHFGADLKRIKKKPIKKGCFMDDKNTHKNKWFSTGFNVPIYAYLLLLLAVLDENIYCFQPGFLAGYNTVKNV